MARSGTPTIVKLARKICKLKALYGAFDLTARTSPAFAAAIGALVVACEAFEALDDYPAEVDRTFPFGEEDESPIT